jgi:hypothetical protein
MVGLSLQTLLAHLKSSENSLRFSEAFLVLAGGDAVGHDAGAGTRFAPTALLSPDVVVHGRPRPVLGAFDEARCHGPDVYARLQAHKPQTLWKARVCATPLLNVVVLAEEKPQTLESRSALPL